MSVTQRLKPWVIVVAVVIAAVFILAACGSSTSSGSSGGGGGTATPAPGGTGATVKIVNFAFSPLTLTVKPGTTVTWVNNDSVPHNVISTDGPGLDAAMTSMFVSSSMSTGQTFSFTFAKAGTYFYECSLHVSLPAMHAKVVVK